MKNQNIDKEFEDLKSLIDVLGENPNIIPDNSIIISPTILLNILTRKRLEALDYISRMSPSSANEIVLATGRKKQSVNRDLKILEANGFISLEKSGRHVIPKIQKKYLVVGL